MQDVKCFASPGHPSSCWISLGINSQRSRRGSLSLSSTCTCRTTRSAPCLPVPSTPHRTSKGSFSGRAPGVSLALAGELRLLEQLQGRGRCSKQAPRLTGCVTLGTSQNPCQPLFPQLSRVGTVLTRPGGVYRFVKGLQKPGQAVCGGIIDVTVAGRGTREHGDCCAHSWPGLSLGPRPRPADGRCSGPRELWGFRIIIF